MTEKYCSCIAVWTDIATKAFEIRPFIIKDVNTFSTGITTSNKA